MLNQRQRHGDEYILWEKDSPEQSDIEPIVKEPLVRLPDFVCLSVVFCGLLSFRRLQNSLFVE